jgi:MarR family 2-MHQ and catechol resistance regulon transcriptional repressor
MATKHEGSKREKRALNTFITLRRAADAVSKQCRTFRDAELTESQFGALDALYHLGPLHLKEIGEKILKTGANTTTVIDNLEQQGLVRRQQDPDDRRYVRVSLTEEGEELFELTFPEHVDRVVEVLDVLTAEEQKTLARLCKKLGKGQSNQTESNHSNSNHSS